MEKLYVYYDFGSCNQGDHSHGLEEFDTLPQAEERVEELRRAALGCGEDDPCIKVIQGGEVCVRRDVRPDVWQDRTSD